MKIFAKSGCCSFLIFALLFTGLAVANPVNSLAIYEHEWSKRNCFKDEPPATLRVNEGDPFKLTCQLLDDCPHFGVDWIKQFSNGTIIKSINDSRISVDPEGTLWFSNATKLDDSNHDFYYSCVALSPLKNEYKIGNRVLLDVASSSNIGSSNKREPAKQYVSKKNEIVLRGKDVELFCIYGGTPLPVTVWSKNGQRLRPNDRVIERNYGKSLLIENVNFDDKSVYTCDVSNGVGSAQSYSINLEVESAPFFLLKPAGVGVAEDETVELVCEAAGVPEPMVEWTYNGRPLTEAPSNPRRSEQPGRLILKSLKKEDAGEYGCNATNTHGYVYKDAYVNVMALAPEILRPPKDDAAVEGKTMKMSCRVIGAPEPAVKWVKDGKELTGERYRFVDTGELQIRGVLFSDAGNYTCVASNKFGSVNASGSLAVKERTRIIDWPGDHEVAAGGTATFRCSAEADSTLHLQIYWQRDGKPIDFESEPRFLLGNDNSLMITKTTESDSGTYTCVASTDLDEVRTQAVLIVQDVPNPPTLLGVTCGSSDAQISWIPTSDNRSPILRYSIQYNTSFAPDTWETAVDYILGAYQTYTVKLSPWANYTFRVIAWNKIGASESSSHSSVCPALANVPYENPEDVGCEGNAPGSLTIKWTSMRQIQHNAPKFVYRVYYKRDIPGEIWTTEDIHDWRINQLRIDNLPTYQGYKIKVGAINERGKSLKVPEEVVCFSGEDVPLQAPGNFTLEKIVSSTKALLSWTKVPDETVRGELRGYKIETWTDEGGEEAVLYVNGTDKTNALVNKLVPHSKNYARIRVHNGRYDGPASPVISFETPEGVPGVVMGLDVNPVNSTALMLKWNKPIEINGILTGYKITYQKITGSEIGPEMEMHPQIRDPEATSAKLSGLSPQTKYRITIRATTNVGEGEPYFLEKMMPAPEDTM